MSSPSSRIAVALLVIGALWLPTAASGQTQTIPQDGAGVSTTPPVQLGGERASTEAGDALPNTGSDPRLLFLAGTALMLLGAGLRLRTADADDY